MPNLLDLIRQGNNNGSLGNIAQLIQLANQQNQGGIPTEKIAGYDIPINRGGRGGFNTGLNSLSSLAGGYQQTQQMQKRNQFLQGVQQIAQEQSTPDEKINKLVGFMAQHGSDYGLGIKEIITQYGQQANRSALTSRFTQNEGGQFQVPEGFEITGYDQKGQPMVRRVKPNIAEQKFNLVQEEKKQQLETKSQFVKDSALDALNTIAEVEKGISNFGLFGSLPSIPGSQRANWEANVNKLLSGKVIDVMTKMKEASKTGATGFGQLSEKELKVLQEASTALKRRLSSKDAQRYLNEMKSKLQKIAQKGKQLDQQTAMGISGQAEQPQNSDYQIGQTITKNGNSLQITPKGNKFKILE